MVSLLNLWVKNGLKKNGKVQNNLLTKRLVCDIQLFCYLLVRSLTYLFAFTGELMMLPADMALLQVIYILNLVIITEILILIVFFFF
jgi:hypothetical protein